MASSSAARSTPLCPPEMTMSLHTVGCLFFPMQSGIYSGLELSLLNLIVGPEKCLDTWVVRGCERVGQCTYRAKVFSSFYWSVLSLAGSREKLFRAAGLG